MEKTAVIALGGNALVKNGEEGGYEDLVRNIGIASKNIIPLINEYKAVITFGNGPQIGYLLLQNEIAKDKVSEMPLDVLGAESQGLIGYLLNRELLNELKEQDIDKKVAYVLTHVLVSKEDGEFKNPSKPIGPFLSEIEAKKLRGADYSVMEDSGRGYRRVVPSPKPVKIIETETIRKLIDDTIVIAAGGGGIPVYEENNKLKGLEAVIDKDLASACLASELEADLFLILMDLNKVAINYGKDNQKFLDGLTIKEAKKYLKEGHFPRGSMGPKIEAAINFLEDGGKKAIITSLEKAYDAVGGLDGTKIKR